MTKKRKATEKSDFDRMLDEIGPDDDDDEPGVDVVSVQGESTPEPSKAAKEEQAPEPEAKVEAKADEPSPEQAEPEPASEPTTEPDPDPASAAPTSQPAATPDASKGLLAEIQKLRAENRQYKAQVSAQAPPQPAPAQIPTQPQPQADVPVQGATGAQGRIPVDFEGDDGAGISAQAVRELVRQEMAPTPEQAAAHQHATTRDTFVAKNPERNGPLFQRAEMGVNWIQEAGQQKAREWGLDVRQMDVGGFVRFANDSGLLAEFGQKFPDMAEDITSIVAAGASGQPILMDHALSRYADRVEFLQRLPSETPQAGEAPEPAVPPLPSGPPSLSSVGSTTPPAGTSDKQRLKQLRKQSQADPLMPDHLYNELEELERKIEGMR